MSSTIRIILINTYHPGNIGSTARAMKTMGLRDLCLVNPSQFPANDATSMAAGAQDILAAANVVNTFDQSVEDCSLIIGTSARNRNMSIPMLEPSECAEKLVIESLKSQVALVFGQETMGMTNEQLQRCHYHVAIPANPEYPVLNVAAAAQILCYEIYQACRRLSSSQLFYDTDAEPFPPLKEMEQFYQHLETTLDEIGFIIRQHPGLAMTRLRRLFNRARPESKELNMLRGILSSVQKKTRKTIE